MTESKQIFPSIKTNWSTQFNCIFVFVSYISRLVAAVSNGFSSAFIVKKKKKVQLRRKQIRHMMKERRENTLGRYVYERSLRSESWKNKSSQVRPESAERSASAARRGEKSFPLLQHRTLFPGCFSVCSADVSHWWHTQIWDQCWALSGTA